MEAEQLPPVVAAAQTGHEEPNASATNSRLVNGGFQCFYIFLSITQVWAAISNTLSQRFTHPSHTSFFLMQLKNKFCCAENQGDGEKCQQT